MKTNLHYLSIEEAKELNQRLKNKGVPTTNRVLIASPKVDGNTKTQSGLFIPSDVEKDTLPRKGIVIQMPPCMTPEENANYPGLAIGSKVTYGLYAGKELPDLLDIDDQVITILTLNEVLYIETNN